MAFMRGLTFPGGQQPIMRGGGVYLRYPRVADYQAWSRLRHESREFLAPLGTFLGQRRTDEGRLSPPSQTLPARNAPGFGLCFLCLQRARTTR